MSTVVKFCIKYIYGGKIGFTQYNGIYSGGNEQNVVFAPFTYIDSRLPSDDIDLP